MKPTLSRVVAEWSDWPQGLHESLNPANSLDQQAESVARLLRRMVPTATVALCELHNQKSTALAVEGGDALDTKIGARFRGWMEGLERPLAGALRFALKDTDPAFTCLACSASCGSFHAGSLALALPGLRSTPTLKAAQTFLRLAASSLATHLRIEASAIPASTAPAQPELQTLRGLLHDVNNCLNGMMLQASVVQMKVDASLRDEVEQIRRQGTEAAALMARVQRLNLW